jgi:uncharacterized protein YfbU (UPF0304 family)
VADIPKLTTTERLILINQFSTLEFLARAFPDVAKRSNTTYHDAGTYAWYQEILEHGHDLLYSEFFGRVYDQTLTEDEQRAILDILDMYNDLQFSFDQLEDKRDLTEESVKFKGWDSNSLKGELSFAESFCFRDGKESAPTSERTPTRFAHVWPSPARESNFNLVDGYYRMLAVYRPIKEARLREIEFAPMTHEQITMVLNALPHPDSPRGLELRQGQN